MCEQCPLEKQTDCHQRRMALDCLKMLSKKIGSQKNRTRHNIKKKFYLAYKNIEWVKTSEENLQSYCHIIINVIMLHTWRDGSCQVRVREFGRWKKWIAQKTILRSTNLVVHRNITHFFRPFQLLGFGVILLWRKWRDRVCGYSTTGENLKPPRLYGLECVGIQYDVCKHRFRATPREYNWRPLLLW